jgi:hypothetical protein
MLNLVNNIFLIEAMRVKKLSNLNDFKLQTANCKLQLINYAAIMPAHSSAQDRQASAHCLQ